MKILGLAAAIGVLLAAQRGALDGLGPALLLVLGAGVAVWAFGRQVITGHGHGPDLLTVSAHEAGHAVAAELVGARVKSETVKRSMFGYRGEVSWRVRRGPDEQVAEDTITILLAGGMAAGTSYGCSYDQAQIRSRLRGLDDPAAVQRRAAARARQIVSSNRGRIERRAAALRSGV